MTPAELDAALDHLRDGTADVQTQDALRRAITGDPALRRAARQRLALDGALLDALVVRRQAPTQPRLRRAGLGYRRQRAAPARTAWALGLAACLALGIVLAWAWLRPATGDTVSAAQGIAISRVHRGASMHGKMQWIHRDGTIISVDGHIAWLDEPGLHYRLEEGRLQVNAATQPADTPLRVSTPHGVATVKGTQFDLRVDATTTRLAVTVGEVAFADATGAAHLVKAGDALLVDATGAPPQPPVVSAKEPPPSPDQPTAPVASMGMVAWRANLREAAERAQPGWFGQAVDDGMAARLDEQLSREMKTSLQRVAVPERFGDRAGYGTVSADLVVEAGFTISQPTWVLVVLGTWEADPANHWRANIQGGGQYAAGTHQLRLHMSNLHLPDTGDASIAQGAVIRQVSVVTSGDVPAGLVVHGLAIGTGPGGAARP